MKFSKKQENKNMLNRVQFSNPYAQQKNISFKGVAEDLTKSYTTSLKNQAMNNPRLEIRSEGQDKFVVRLTDGGSKKTLVTPNAQNENVCVEGKGSTITDAFANLQFENKGKPAAYQDEYNKHGNGAYKFTLPE
jgi:hypothetical protein